MTNGGFNYIPDELVQDKYKKPDALKVNFNIKLEKPEVKDANDNLPLYRSAGINKAMFSSPVALSSKPLTMAKTNIEPKSTRVVAINDQHSKDEVLFCAVSVLATIDTKKPKKRTIEMMNHDSLFESNITTNIKIDKNVPKIFTKGESVKRTAWGRYYKVVQKINPLNYALKIPQFTAEEIEALWSSAKEKTLSQKEADLILNIKTIFEGSVVTTRRKR